MPLFLSRTHIMANINQIEDVFYTKEDLNPQPTRIYTEEEEAQNIEDEKRMADMAGWEDEHEESSRYKNYDNLEDMLADGIDIDDIPKSYHTKKLKEKTVPKPVDTVETKTPREEDIEYIPF
jgi:hypothetical protein